MNIRAFVKYARLSPYLVFCYFNWILPYSKHPEKYPIDVRFAKFKKLSKVCVNIMKPNLEAHNLEYMNQHDGPFVGIANHRYYMDPFFIAHLSDRPVSFVAKKEVEKIPFVGRVLKSIDGYFIDREDLMSQVKLFKTIAERLKKGDISYFIFPEGTRMKEKTRIQTLPYKDGSLKLAYWSNLDVIYLAHLGTETVFDKPLPGHDHINITFKFFKPIKFADLEAKSTVEVMPLIEKETNDALFELAEENRTRGQK